MNTFAWTATPNGMSCTWHGVVMAAQNDGIWVVAAGTSGVVSSDDQVRGANIQDAMRRAQAAAMVLHSLRENLLHQWKLVNR